MTRRSLLKSMVVIGGWICWKPGKRYGALTVEAHRRLCHRGVHLHTWHNGQDVTSRCRFADDTGDGMAELYLHNAAGRPYLLPDKSGPAMETVYGVTFKEGAPFS